MTHALPLRIGSALVLAGVLAGCAVGPDYQPPEPPLPDQFSATTAPVAGAASLTAWWATFDDPLLTTLLERAVAHNHDLRIATARVHAARGLRGVSGAGLYPQIDATGSVSRQRISRNSANLPQGIPIDREYSNFQAGFDATWELDFFGGVRRNIEAADADLSASESARDEVLVSLLAEVARNYIELRSVQQRIALAEDTMASQERTVVLTRDRSAAGLSTDLDVAQAEAQVANTSALIPPLQTERARAIHRISVLLGSPAGALMSELSPVARLPFQAPEIPPGIPADLLRRRADIRRAERQLAATSARIGVATADLYPRFALAGSLGLQSRQFNEWADRNSLLWGIGPSFSWPIFNAGRIRAGVAVAEARYDESLAVYEQTVLLGIEEVENALTAYANEQLRRDRLQKAVDASRRALDLANHLYTHGRFDFLNVLEAERTLYLSEEALAISQQNVATGLVAVYKALGGGWEDAEAALLPADRPADD